MAACKGAFPFQIRSAVTAIAVTAVLSLLVACSNAGAGDSGGPVAHGEGVSLDSPLIISWATALGPGGYDPGLGAQALTESGRALGPASGSSSDVVVLGDGGTITLDLGTTVSDGEGADIAVWENGFNNGALLFAELAFVAVSSDGTTFAQFPATTTRNTTVGAFESIDPTDYAGFAGLHTAGTGTAFDLSRLENDPLVTSGSVDLSAIRYVRIIDVVGDGNTLDDNGSPIYDPNPTINPDITTNTAGFDLDGVAMLRSQ